MAIQKLLKVPFETNVLYEEGSSSSGVYGFGNVPTNTVTLQNSSTTTVVDAEGVSVNGQKVNFPTGGGNFVTSMQMLNSILGPRNTVEVADSVDYIINLTYENYMEMVAPVYRRVPSSSNFNGFVINIPVGLRDKWLTFDVILGFPYDHLSNLLVIVDEETESEVGVDTFYDVTENNSLASLLEGGEYYVRLTINCDKYVFLFELIKIMAN